MIGTRWLPFGFADVSSSVSGRLFVDVERRRRGVRQNPAKQIVRLWWLFPSDLLEFQLSESGHGRLETCVVVQRHLVVDVLLPQVYVVVVLVRSANHRSVKNLWIGLGTPVCVPIAGGRSVRTRTANRSISTSYSDYGIVINGTLRLRRVRDQTAKAQLYLFCAVERLGD